MIAQSRSEKELQIQTVVEGFFNAYQKKDLDALMSLWSKTAPDLADVKQDFRDSFASVGVISLKGLATTKIEFGADSAAVRVAVELTALDRTTGKPGDGFGKLDMMLRLVREGGVWKVWKYASSEEDLAATIALAKTEKERDALLDANRELVTADLDKALVEEGRQLWAHHDQAHALGAFTFAGELAAKLNDKPGWAKALWAIGQFYNAKSDYSLSMDYYQRSLLTATEAGDKADVARAFSSIGLLHCAQGRPKEAVEAIQKSLKIREELGDKGYIAASQVNLGVVFFDQGDYMRALEYDRAALKNWEEIGDTDDLQVALNGIGNVESALGNYQEAENCFQRDLRSSQESGDMDGVARALVNIGGIKDVQGNYLNALESYQKALDLWEGMGDKSGTAVALDDIGHLYLDVGNYPEALEYFQKCLQVSQEIDFKLLTGDVLISTGSAYLAQANYPLALEYYDKGLKLAQTMGAKPQVAQALDRIGAVHFARGDYPKALDYFQQSLKINEAISDRVGIALTLDGISKVYSAQHDYTRVVELENRSASITRQLDSSDLLAQVRTTAGQAYNALGDPASASQAFADAIAAIEKMRTQIAGSEQEKQQFMENRVTPYYAMADLLIDQNKFSDALAFAERAKARTLLDVLESGRININRHMTDQENDKERKLNAELVSLNTQITKEKVRLEPDQTRLVALNSQLDKARLAYEAFQTSLYVAHPELRIQRAGFQAITLSDCVDLVRDSNSALVEFLVSTDRVDLFVLTKDNEARGGLALNVHKIAITQQKLAELCESFRQRLSDQGLGYTTLARQLYDLLLKPAAAQLNGKSRIVVVPDGPLWDLPFQALQSARRHFLIQDAAVSYAPSLTALREMSKARPNTGLKAPSMDLIAFGDPKLPDEARANVRQLMGAELGPLPETRGMVAALGKLYGPEHSRLYLGADASEDRLKAEASKCRILQIAAHGIVNNTSPMYSQIVLSRPAGSLDDGTLEAWEVLNLDLNADLVVLTACETARGRVGAGEGMIGLTWAFFVAGCPTTVATQWKVEAESTTPLMVEFHRNLLAGVGKSEALRRAELKVMRTKQYAHPFYWAGFVIVGSDR